MKKAALILIRIARVLAAVIAVWQVVGLLPVLTWFSELSQVTIGMWFFVGFKVVILIACLLVSSGLNRLAARLRARTSDQGHGADVNEPSGDGTTPLIGAAMRKKTKQIQLISADINVDAADRGWRTFAINPFLCKSEGMRRISIVLLTVSVLAWFTFVGVKTEGFDGLPPGDWLILFAFPFGAYLSVMALRSLAIWIVAGFRKEAQ